jgi:hypothetical protein
VTTKHSGAAPRWARHKLFLLVIALAFVLSCRMLLYAWMPERNSELDVLYDAAARLLRRENPYPLAGQSYPYPLPAVLLAVPFTLIPLELARLVFDILAGWAFAFALWKYRGPYALLALVSGAYLFALGNGQTLPLMVAASLVPALGLLLAVRPTTSAALWVARPSWMAALGVGAFLVLSFLLLPSWPRDWWAAFPVDQSELTLPVLLPFGFILLLGAIRWRLPEGRLVFALALIPQTTLPYELVPLALVPGNRVEMAIYVAGTWIAVAAAEAGWLVTLSAVYLPMLYLVLRRKSSTGPRIEKERRRPHRLPDDELKIDVTTDGAGAVVVKVTHIPTQQSTTESGKSRKLAERKAHDRLAAILRGRSGTKDH